MKQALETIFHRLFDAIIEREVDARVTSIFDRELDARIKRNRLHDPIVFGDVERLSVDPTAIVNNALFNTSSGRIVVGKYAFFGHSVSILTGTHDFRSFGEQRQRAIPSEGRDVIIGDGAWVASNASVLGPCTVGKHAVVAAGAVVTTDVQPFSIVAGVPAKLVGRIEHTDATASHDSAS